jgi:hypothetical protein
MVNNRRTNSAGTMYYRCNGKQNGRGIYAATGQRCPSKDIRGEGLEELVWADVEGFLRNPGPVLEQLQRRLSGDVAQPTQLDRSQLQKSLKSKGDERTRVLALFRRGRINDAELDAQLDAISVEEESLQRSLAELDGYAQAAAQSSEFVNTAGALLAQLRRRLDQGVSWEMKRELIDILVGQIRVEGAHKTEKERPVVRITYRFSATTDTCTDTGSSRRSG